MSKISVYHGNRTEPNLLGSFYYLEGTTFSLAFGSPWVAPFGLALFLTGVELEQVWVVASCEVLRRRVAAVRGRSTGTVGARTERGCLVGQSL